MMKFMLIGLLINSVLQSIPMPASEIVEEIEVINRRQEFKNIFEKIEERKLVQEEITEEEIETFENEEIIEEDVPEEINKQWVTFELSAYCPCEYCCDTYTGITASGLNVEVGMCAAPDNIPFDSICVIPELGMELNVQDRGGYIMNTYDGLVRLDVYFNSHEEALEFGRRVIEGYIVYP